MQSNPQPMSGVLCVLQADLEATGRAGISEQPAAGPQAGFYALAQSLLWLGPNAVAERATGGAEETLFVLEGHGVLRLAVDEYALEPESGANLAPYEKYALQAGVHGMRVVRVRVPEPEAETATTARTAVSRLADRPAEEATTERRFRIVADPSTGLRSATHFVGYIPAARAPVHFHTYDEVIYVLEGDGWLHTEGARQPVGPGTCIGLPARLVHCLENTGHTVMRVQAVFRPAGSPATAYYPDGTPAGPGQTTTVNQ